jgi:hypothetical protein
MQLRLEDWKSLHMLCRRYHLLSFSLLYMDMISNMHIYLLPFLPNITLSRVFLLLLHVDNEVIRSNDKNGCHDSAIVFNFCCNIMQVSRMYCFLIHMIKVINRETLTFFCEYRNTNLLVFQLEFFL